MQQGPRSGPPVNPLDYQALAWKFTRRARFLGDPAIDAEDLSQDIMADLIRAAKVYDPARAAFMTLAWRCARNAVSNARRKAVKRNRMVGLAEDPKGCEDRSVENADTCERLLSVLTPRERKIVTLWMQGRKLLEIAKALGFSRSYASYMIRAAHDKMRATAIARRAA